MDKLQTAGRTESSRAQVVLGVEGLSSTGTERAVEATLARLPGVTAVVSLETQTIRIEFDRATCALPEIVRRLDALGLHLRPNVSRNNNDPTATLQQTMQTAMHTTSQTVARAMSPTAAGDSRQTMLPNVLQEMLSDRALVMALIGGVLLIAAYLVHYNNGPNWLRIALIIPAYILTGWFTFLDTAKVLWEVRFDIDVLMFAAAFGAAALGKYEEGGLLLFLFALGGAGEQIAMDRARRAIAALAKLAPEIATLRDVDGTERIVKVADLKIADQVVIRPFDRVPADGIVVLGTSAIDQSPITGESVPVEKIAKDPVYAGCINGEGLLVVAVSKAAGESTLARIVKMVEAAQSSKSPTQLFTDKVEKFYVPLVLIATALVMILPPLLGILIQGESLWGGWFYRAMAFLTAASPCALAIGTPAAVLSGISRAARAGVLIKGGVHLENLGRVRAIAFDKTGTLTRGKPELTDVVIVSTGRVNDSMDADHALALAAAVEQHSSHPLAHAIVAAAQQKHCADMNAENIQQIPAAGMRATINGQIISIGKLSMSPDTASNYAFAKSTLEKLSAEGKTAVVLAIDDNPYAVLALSDRARTNAGATLKQLKALGIERTVMLTGDNMPVATAIAGQLGIDEFAAELLPQSKVDKVLALKEKYGYVAMVGDGVNDAPAMANATVGIAMGGAGTDVALESADIALMADDLGKLPEAIGLSRFSRKIIKQNMIIALSVIAILAPTAALGGTSLGIAVLFHEGSTVVVVLNALRLLIYKVKV